MGQAPGFDYSAGVGIPREPAGHLAFLVVADPLVWESPSEEPMARGGARRTAAPRPSVSFAPLEVAHAGAPAARFPATPLRRAPSRGSSGEWGEGGQGGPPRGLSPPAGGPSPLGG